MNDEPGREVPGQVLDFLHAHQTMTLASVSPGAVPHASTFLYVNDGPTLYFWSRANSTTARHVQRNPVVAFTVDAFSEDLEQIQGLQGVGECSVLLSGEKIAHVADMFGRKFPALSPGSTMSISFFRLAPAEIQFIDNRGGSSREIASGAFGAEFHREHSYSVIMQVPRQASDSIVASLQTIQVPAGETIARQGAPADKFFILLEGDAEVLRDERGVETTIASLRPGDLFGEVAIMHDRPRSATVQARTSATLLAIERESFRELIAQSLELVPDFDRVLRAQLEAQSSV